MLANAGFVDVQLGEQVDVFSGSVHESSAANFETYGLTIFGRKPAE
ncbi:MAG: hypothetical protein O3C10_08090 [Chloroflexi bacterium]|nr:hypothetical protein [Chloroflexota bacterium]